MVSAAKFAKAERELKPARVYGAGAKGLYKIGQLRLFYFPIVKGKTLFTEWQGIRLQFIFQYCTSIDFLIKGKPFLYVDHCSRTKV